MGQSNQFQKPDYKMTFGSDITATILSPNGQFLAVGIGREQIALYNFNNLDTPLVLLSGCCASILSKCFIAPVFSHDSKMLAYRWNELVYIFSTETLKPIKVINNGSKWITASFSPDNRYIAVANHWFQDDLNVYDLQKDSSQCFIGVIKARVVQKMNKKEFAKIEPQWAPNSNHILSRWNNNVQVHLATPEGVVYCQTLVHGSDIWDISFSPNGQQLAVTTQSICQVWDWANGKSNHKAVKGCSNPSNFSCWINPHTVFSPDSKYFAVAHKKSCLIYSSNLELAGEVYLDDTVHSMLFSPKGTYLGIGYRTGYVVYDFASMTKLKTIELCTSKSFQDITPAWSHDENLLVGRWNTDLNFWNMSQVIQGELVSKQSFDDINEICDGKLNQNLLDTQQSFYPVKTPKCYILQ